jgi:putative nucleotide binding protein
MERKRYEEYGYVLDYLPRGKTGFGKGYIAEPTVQVVGEVFFTLLEAVVKPNAIINLHERVYVGKDQREKISHIIGRVGYEELTPTAKSELPAVIEEIVKLQELRFVEFFNKAQPITPRMHAFELLPGIGKKYMWQIVNERDKKPFASFKEIQERANVPDPVKAIVRRILDELTSDQKYRIFTRQT